LWRGTTGDPVRLVYWLATLAAALVLTVFAVSNPERVEISLWPFLALQAPLFLVVIISLVLGFLLGELVAWVNGRHWRREARRRARRIEALERELAATQAQLPRGDNPRLPARSGQGD
jgi:lipopolysaccharide assembly protein A